VTEVTVQQALDAAYAHHAAGRLGEAEPIYRQILARDPENTRALNLLGVLAYQAGHHAEAFELIGRAIALRPEEADYRCNLGVVLAAMGRTDDAIAAYRVALSLAPADADVYCNLGNALSAKGDAGEAIAAFERAIAIKPQSPEALANLGRVLNDAGRTGEAIAACERAAAIRPQMAEAHWNLGRALAAAGRDAEAAEAYRRALALRPDVPEVWNNFGGALMRQNRLDEAVAAYRHVIRLRPSDAEGQYNLGKALLTTGELDGAIACFERSAAIRPELGGESQRLITMLLHPGYSPEAVLREHEQWARRFAALTEAAPPHENDASPERRLRVGYVSPDFREHVVAMNLLPLFREHDKSQVEVFCYHAADTSDLVTERFRAGADHWRDVHNFTDERLAELIRADRIDVLVDLGLHAGGRLLAFACKPAPVRATFAGYPGTTGLPAIDYRLTDPYLDPPGENDRWYTEESFRLPHSFWCYAPAETPAVNSLPALTNGHVTFGSLNNFPKVNAPMLRVWSAVLRAVERSRLILLAPEGSSRRRVLDVTEGEGISRDRVEFASRLPRPRYLEQYLAIDIALDTFPYNGHTTSLDSLWMGVPMVTLAGPTAVSRAGYSQLCNLGLSDLAARSAEEFVDIAAALARDLPRLATIRASLRPRMQRSPLTDAIGWTRGIEAAYRSMWRQWCERRR
jgi:predicted O-linked N-acetylglucosamine transferase (SPINDLY family)